VYSRRINITRSTNLEIMLVGLITCDADRIGIDSATLHEDNIGNFMLILRYVSRV